MPKNSATAQFIERRERLLGPNLDLFYEEPVHVVRGEGVWLFDSDGRQYLDCYNNVPHVGHAHPVVVDAIAKQAATLNTHTRYLHDGILDYAERLTETFNADLTTTLLTCTGSEANDVALRMAEAVTGHRGIIATDATYHGNTAAVTQLSSTRPPIGGYTGHVRHVPAPDGYRPMGGEPGEAFAAAFTREVEQAIEYLQTTEFGFSTLILCPYFANEGFPKLPSGFFDGTVAAVRKAGGIIIADEVQPGFGRLGSHFWGHERAGFTPDVVTLGKPMANGHPVGGVVTTTDIMTEFRMAFGYFNTFGGNPVSCAAAMATLAVVQQENLMQNAAQVGEYALAGLSRLADKHEVIGEVRGSGLYFGIELVEDQTRKTPAADMTTRLVNSMRENGVLMGRTGLHHNVLKIRPPLPFGRDHVDQLIDTLDASLSAEIRS
jgi:4-aminobutyrate aminotransferase-like enzyme